MHMVRIHKLGKEREKKEERGIEKGGLISLKKKTNENLIKGQSKKSK